MSDWIGRVQAIAEQIIKSLVTGDGLVLTKCLEQIRKRISRDIQRGDCLTQRYKNRMTRISLITRIELRFPLIEQLQRCLRIADLVSQIVGDTAVGVDIEEMLTQSCRQKPAGYREIFVVRAGQTFTVLLCFSQRWRRIRNGVFRRQSGPSRGMGGCGHVAG